MHVGEADPGKVRAISEGGAAYGIQTVVLEAHRRQPHRVLAQALGDIGNVVVDDQVRDIARGDGVALGIVLVDGLRQIALFIAGVHITAGHQLAERVQDPLLRRLIVGGALGRHRFPSGFGGSRALFAGAFASGRSSAGAFASSRLGIRARRRAPSTRRGIRGPGGVIATAGRRCFAQAIRQRGTPRASRRVLGRTAGDRRERDHKRHGKQHSEKGIANTDALHSGHLSTASPTCGTQGNAYLIL